MIINTWTYEKNDDLRAENCQVHAVREYRVNHEPAAKNIEMMNMGIKQARLTNLEIR